MSNQLSSKGALAYQGTNAQMPPNTFVFPRAPTTQDYQNFELGDYWIHRISRTSNDADIYVLLGVVQHVANWVLFSGGSGSVTKLTGNTGGPVSPLAGNINTVGDGVGITITGNPGTHTLTASLIGGGVAAQSFPANSGTATPNASGVLNILGDTTTITTTGAGNTITAAATGAVATLYTEDSGTATPSGHNLNILGAGGITTSGAGNTVTITGSGGTVTTLHTDDGNNVTATAGVINITGTNGLTTTGTVGPNTVTIALSPNPTPSFIVSANANITNVTGDGTSYVCQFNTESYDLSSSFNTATGLFTAPVNGVYLFYANIIAQNFAVGHTGGYGGFSVNGGGGVFGMILNPYVCQGLAGIISGQVSFPFTASFSLTAGDTVAAILYVDNSTKTVTFGESSYFGGYLMR